MLSSPKLRLLAMNLQGRHKMNQRLRVLKKRRVVGRHPLQTLMRISCHHLPTRLIDCGKLGLTIFNCEGFWRGARSRPVLARKPSRRTGRYCIRRRCRALGCGLSSLTCGCRSFRELEHICALRVLGALSALLGWQRAIGIYLLLESLEERFSRGTG